METVQALTSCVTFNKIAQIILMKIKYFVLITSVKIISGNALISTASPRPGSVTVRMTVETTQMRTALTVQPEPAIQGNLNVITDAAYLRAGNVMSTMTVGITLMNLSRNAWALLTAATITLILTARQTIVVSHSGLCAMVMMTAGITLMSRIVNKEHAIHVEIFAVKIIVVFLCVGSVMATMTAETDLMSATAVLGSAQKVNLNVIICTAFLAAGSVTTIMTAKITQMKETVK